MQLFGDASLLKPVHAGGPYRDHHIFNFLQLAIIFNKPLLGMAPTECLPSACLPCLPYCLLACLHACLLACVWTPLELLSNVVV